MMISSTIHLFTIHLLISVHAAPLPVTGAPDPKGDQPRANNSKGDAQDGLEDALRAVLVQLKEATSTAVTSFCLLIADRMRKKVAAVGVFVADELFAGLRAGARVFELLKVHRNGADLGAGISPWLTALRLRVDPGVSMGFAVAVILEVVGVRGVCGRLLVAVVVGPEVLHTVRVKVADEGVAV